MIQKLTETFALSRPLVQKHFSTDHVAKWGESCGQIGVREVVGQVVDEQIRSRRAYSPN